jgi:hypothetical protein
LFASSQSGEQTANEFSGNQIDLFLHTSESAAIGNKLFRPIFLSSQSNGDSHPPLSRSRTETVILRFLVPILRNSFLWKSLWTKFYLGIADEIESKNKCKNLFQLL